MGQNDIFYRTSVVDALMLSTKLLRNGYIIWPLNRAEVNQSGKIIRR